MSKITLDDFKVPNTCGECRFIAYYNSGPFARNPHCCCELIWGLKDEDYKVDQNQLDENCPLKVLDRLIEYKEYKEKLGDIEAIQWTGLNLEEIKSFVGEYLHYDINDAAWRVGKGSPCINMVIETLEGPKICTEGDYIIKGINGDFRPCKPDVFEKTYQIKKMIIEVKI